MDKVTRLHLDNLDSPDGDLRYQSLLYVLNVTEKRVDWAYEVWDEMVENLNHEDNHRRAIAAQILCNLAKSDPEGRILKDFDALLAVTKDKKFVTARHCLQSIWKVGAGGKEQQQMVVEGLADRFRDCISEKNWSLIRFDIIQGLSKLFNEVHDEQVREKALELIAEEEDNKYRKKYADLWRSK